MDIKRLMTRHPVTVSLDDTLGRVRDLFQRHRFHHLLVVEDGRLVGVVSDRDLLKALSPNLGNLSENTRDRASLNKRVHQIMARNLRVLRDDASVEDAIRLFNSERISCIPIVDQRYAAVGILSWRDVMRSLSTTAL